MIASTCVCSEMQPISCRAKSWQVPLDAAAADDDDDDDDDGAAVVVDDDAGRAPA